jgi:hypothetical protein
MTITFDIWIWDLFGNWFLPLGTQPQADVELEIFFHSRGYRLSPVWIIKKGAESEITFRPFKSCFIFPD